MADIFDMPQLPEILSFDVDTFTNDSLANSCSFFDEDNCLSSIVQVQKTQDRSPFHESDSGVSQVSDVTDIGINSPVRDTDMMLDEMLDNMTARPFLAGSDDDQFSPDIDLVDYLSGGMQSVTSDGHEYTPESGSQSQPVHQTRARSAAFAKESDKLATCERDTSPVVGIPQSDFLGVSGRGVSRKIITARRRNRAVQRSSSSSTTSSDLDVSEAADIGNSPSFSRRQPRGSVRVGQVGSVLPSADSVSDCNITSVKVLRIVNAGNGCTTEDSVAKALEDRNRKNAEMAKQNRLKKKAYLGGLEQEVEDGRKRIDQLETSLHDAEEDRDSYKREVEYLKAVLANQSALAGLLKNIPNASGVSLSSSVTRKRVTELDHSYVPMKKQCQSARPASTAGVCLHVDSDSVSLEFCHHCAKMAKGGHSS